MSAASEPPRTGLPLSRLGLGTAAFGGGGWRRSFGPQDDALSRAVIMTSLERGIDWLDTAPIYGLGHAERLIGETLAALPAETRPRIATKVGLVLDAARPFDSQLRDLRPSTIRRELADSLRRLRTDHIDLYQVHWPDPATPIEDSWGEMCRLVDEGSVRHIGVCNLDVDLLGRVEAVRHIDAMQVRFSAISRDAAASTIPWAAAHGVPVLAYGALHAGVLTDAFDASRVGTMAPDDWRRGHTMFAGSELDKGLALRDVLRDIAGRLGSTTEALALAWVLARPGVSSAIVGARTPEQLSDWAGAQHLVLDGSATEAIRVAIERSGAGSGPTF